MPTLTIDGQEVTVERGQTVLQAAAQLGIDIPTFCYHPGLSRPANCRMCLVELEGRDPSRPPPKPIPACYTGAGDGMVVHTKSDKTKRMRQSVLEFILLNHPVDCPICDQAGECVLQDHYFNYSAQPSRLNMRKVHKAKAKPLGPDVMLDAERCILCTRCVRFCDEVAKSSQLEVINRGEKAEITTFPGEQLDNPYSGNTVDICPVGALTSRDFRFRTRVWFLQSAESVCPECSRGCRIRVDTFENTVRRYKPLPNPNVNDYWMCDTGRLSYNDYVDERMEGPGVTREGRRVTVSSRDAVDEAADMLGGVENATVGVIVTPWFTNEDALLVAKLVGPKGALEGAHVWLGGRNDGGDQDDVLIRNDKNPNRRGVTEVFGALGVKLQAIGGFDGAGLEALLIFGDNHALTDVQLKAVNDIQRAIVVGSHMGALWRDANVFLPERLFTEKDGTFANFEGTVQRIYRATKAASTVKSSGWYAMKLQELLSEADGIPFSSPLAIFGALTAEVPAFAGLSWAALAPHGQKLGANTPSGEAASTAGADTGTSAGAGA